MKRDFIQLVIVVCLLLLLGFSGSRVVAQSSVSSWRCDSAVGACGVQSHSYSLAVNGGSAPSGPNYGCLSSQPNASWFFFQTKDTGSLSMDIKTAPARDIDYVLWGPFTTPLYQCDTGMGASKVLSCSNARNTSTNSFSLTGLATNTYYILVISNYSNQNATLSFNITSGNASFNCDVECNVYGITAYAGACDTGVNSGTYKVTGTILSYLFPTTGTLTVSSSCGGSVTYNPPFSSSLNYTIPNAAAGKGENCYITAVYSAIPSCSRTAQMYAPVCCEVTPGPNVTVCEGQPIQLTSSSNSGGVYHWSGPASFSSALQNPSISSPTSASGGAYQLYLVNGACTTSTKTVEVTVNPKPTPKQIVHE